MAVICYGLHRGLNISARVLLNLINELRKTYIMQGFAEHMFI